jgi:hypothetical protein
MRVLLLLLLPIASIAEPISGHQSIIYIADGSAAEISQRAQHCVTRHLQFEPVIRTSYSSVPVGSKTPPQRLVLEGGSPLIASTTGLISARLRERITVHGDRRSLQANLAIESKQGRFRFRFTEIGALSLSRTNTQASYEAPDSDSKLGIGTIRALENISERLSHCIQRETPEPW